MKFIQLLACILLVSYAYANVSYTVRTVRVGEKPAGSGDEFAINLASAVEGGDQPVGYCEKENPAFPLNNQSMCGGPNNNIGWKITFNFDDPEGANYQIQFGTDFGWGSIIIVDGLLEVVRTDDMWWDGNWNSGAVFELNYDFAPGSHFVQIYGAEGCCDGHMDVRINRNGSGFTEFDPDVIQEQIPEGPSGDCIILFTECNFSGESLTVCEDNPDTNNIQVKSLYVPEGVVATLYNTVNWTGYQAEFTESVDCMEGPDFQSTSFLQAHNIHIINKVQLRNKSKTHLKKQK